MLSSSYQIKDPALLLGWLRIQLVIGVCHLPSDIWETMAFTVSPFQHVYLLHQLLNNKIYLLNFTVYFIFTLVPHAIHMGCHVSL